MITEFNKFLLSESERGNNVVLIIDESQNLKIHQLEQVRLLSNLETQKSKLLQIVLVGQPELNRKLDLYDLRQLQQRITVRYHITPLDKEELARYIEHRLIIASSSIDKINFTEEALKMIYDFSGGVPRLVNIICDRALLAAFVEETRKINSDILKKCQEELGSYFIGERQ
jgi:general secretion pathway protein A